MVKCQGGGGRLPERMVAAHVLFPAYCVLLPMKGNY